MTITREIVLTSAESKKLIAKGVLKLEETRTALNEGILALHPSSSTLFIRKEIIPEEEFSGLWVCGTVVPRGLCISAERDQEVKKKGNENRSENDVGSFSNTWIFRKGELAQKESLNSLLKEMNDKDVYVKGANALTPNGKAGVLYGNPHLGGGTIGRVLKMKRKKNFEIIIPIGLEKLIPVSIYKAAKAAKYKSLDHSMGIPCGLIPVNGRVVTEIDAIKILSDADATPIAAGGLNGAEGATILSISGRKKSVHKASKIIKSIKGAHLPPLHQPDCSSCSFTTCHLKRSS